MTFVSNAPSSPQEVAPEHDKNSPPPKAAGSIPPEIAEKLAQEQSYLSKYGYWIILASVLGGVIGFVVSRRFLERESNRIAAKNAKVVAASTIPSHPRRASFGGPLQASEEAANAIREALYILKATPEVKSALGENLKEARMNLLSGGKSAINGQIAVKGEKGQGTLSIEAAKSEFGAEMHVTKLSLKLADGTEIPITLARGEESE